MPMLIIGIAAINGFLAVALGAFAAHGLKARLAPDMLAIFQTGVQYQMYHALAMFGVGLLCMQISDSAMLRASAWLFLTGIIIFSGSLYVLSLSGIRWLGAITPIGGVAFIAGWLLLAAAMFFGRSA
ncbi:DUF423 domain-containing protein [Gammaproteobacteria bacterium LSUCC0112]|nr:DUF423 domain-containing protein [Gammaproteobacteria bacterium LSUCC0112]